MPRLSGIDVWFNSDKSTIEKCDIPDALGEVAGSGVDQAVDLRNQILGPI